MQGQAYGLGPYLEHPDLLCIKNVKSQNLFPLSYASSRNCTDQKQAQLIPDSSRIMMRRSGSCVGSTLARVCCWLRVSRRRMRASLRAIFSGVTNTTFMVGGVCCRADMTDRDSS